MSAAMVPQILAHRLRRGVERAEDFFDRFLFEPGRRGNRLVEFRHISGVMFVVMNLHRLRVDVRFERVVIVAERGQLEDFSGAAPPPPERASRSGEEATAPAVRTIVFRAERRVVMAYADVIVRM